MTQKIFTTIASLISIGFGSWHFFVPNMWNWHSYIDSSATELVLAVDAINYFFSLLLVLIGVMNILLIWNDRTSDFTLVVVLSVSVILWIARSILQVVRPQGTMNQSVQYGMLVVFVVVASMYLASVVLIVSKR
jgi:fucose 4-O-acetylase-like acetyltransferase